MNILVTGANGQLGTSLRLRANSLEDKHSFIFTDINELDITNAQAVNDFVTNHDINLIINCAAYTNVNKAESDFDTAQLINATAVRNLADALLPGNGFLIHISTDYVFGGAEGNTPRNESQPTAPTGVYGITKLHGEQQIAQSGVKAIVLRTSWLYSEFGNNFMKTMLSLTSSKPEISVVFDQIGTPTYAGDLADAILHIIQDKDFRSKTGVYHFSNEGVCSWYDFASMIAQIAGNSQCVVLPCHSDEFPSPVTRPAYSVLDKSKYKSTFSARIPFWIDSLRHCIASYLNSL